jgi:beta-lactamase class A
MDKNDVSVVALRQRFGFVRRHKHVLFSLGAVLLILMIGSVVVQCVYVAQGKALPFSKVDDIPVTGMNKAQVAKLLQATYAPTQLTLKVQKATVKTTLAKAGITPDYNKVALLLYDRAKALRFVPFSFLRGIVRPVPVGTMIDQDRFAEFAKEIVPQCQVAPVDADVAVTDKGDLQLQPAVDGATCTAASLQTQLETTPMTKQGVTRTVALTTVKPTVSTASAQALLTQAKALTARQITVQLLDKSYTPSSAQIASWLTFDSDPITKKPSVGFDSSALTTYLTTLQKDIYIAPTTTTIQLQDGSEVSRQTGTNGRGIDMTKSVQLLQNQLQQGDGVVTLTTINLTPPIAYNRNYSKTQAGLQALLNDLVASKGDYAISLRQLGGNGWNASTNGGKVYTPASTYKLFVAYALLKQIENGQRSWTDDATAGQNISQCFDNMIINSDNACAEWFGGVIGWKTITDMIHAVGLSNATSLNTPQGFVATADDEALFLTKLQTGQLLNPDSTSRLLSVMQRQVYRSGIPAGAGATVADKVGFLNGLLHDAAIVYAPSGTYVLVIMTNGSSWGQIADATRQIAALLQ